MSVRLVIEINAKPGKGAELAKLQAERCLEVQKEDGCLQFEIFQSALNPDKLVLLELWESPAALEVHAARNASAPANPAAAALRADGPAAREDYTYNRTR
jgi:quinol monooxygenase YgiN